MVGQKSKSRKFILTIVQISITVLIPILYKLLGISEQITMVCLTTSSTLAGGYLLANAVVAKKNDQGG